MLEANTWRQDCEVETLPRPEGQYIFGVDLGGSAAMSAIAAYEPISGRLEVVAAFPWSPTLLQRGRKDNVGNLYEKDAG